MGDSGDEIVIVPSAFSDAMADGDLVAIGQLKDVSDDAIDEGDIGGSIVFSGSAVVFAQVHVQHPMQAVFDLPVGSCDFECQLCRPWAVSSYSAWPGRSVASRSLARLYQAGLFFFSAKR